MLGMKYLVHAHRDPSKWRWLDNTASCLHLLQMLCHSCCCCGTVLPIAPRTGHDGGNAPQFVSFVVHAAFLLYLWSDDTRLRAFCATHCGSRLPRRAYARLKRSGWPTTVDCCWWPCSWPYAWLASSTWLVSPCWWFCANAFISAGLFCRAISSVLVRLKSSCCRLRTRRHCLGVPLRLM